MEPRGDLSRLFEQHRVIVCAGAGGVGKTTVSAALALGAAERGRNTLCLTIDPARRLASSLGLSEFPREEMEVPKAHLLKHGISISGRLTVMMLDPRATFDDLIYRFAASPIDAQRIISRPVYGHLADNLAGTQAYMAMEKVLSVWKDERYDLIVLDTPPSARALDFFDAPKKMSAILDSPATRALIGTLGRGSKLQLSLLGAGLRAAMRALERITGGHLLVEVADLLAAMNELLGGFEERAAEVDQQMRSSQFGYVLVTSPRDRTIGDALELARAMGQRGLPISATVINRTATPLSHDFGNGEVLSATSGRLSALGLSANVIDRLLQLGQEEGRRIAQEREVCRPLAEFLGASASCVSVPALGRDIYRPDRIDEIARLLLRTQF
jgi:anion-transporting  ArsA/GET3 family ATPase